MPLDAAWHYSTCIRLHPNPELTIAVKLRIVANVGEEYQQDTFDAQSGNFQEIVDTNAPNPYLVGVANGITSMSLLDANEVRIVDGKSHKIEEKDNNILRPAE